MKFGGTSVEDAAAFERVIGLVRAERGAHPVVVVSAMSRFTDALLKAFERAAGGEGAGALADLEEHFARHTAALRTLLCDLPKRRDCDAALSELESVLAGARGEVGRAFAEASEGSRPLPLLQDLVVSYGEQLSSWLLARALDARGLKAKQVDSRRCVITDDEHGRATPLKEETDRHTREQLRPLIEERVVPVVGAFI